MSGFVSYVEKKVISGDSFPIMYIFGKLSSTVMSVVLFVELYFIIGTGQGRVAHRVTS